MFPGASSSIGAILWLQRLLLLGHRDLTSRSSMPLLRCLTPPYNYTLHSYHTPISRRGYSLPIQYYHTRSHHKTVDTIVKDWEITFSADNETSAEICFTRVEEERSVAGLTDEVLC